VIRSESFVFVDGAVQRRHREVSVFARWFISLHPLHELTVSVSCDFQ
jgi:hypothetical protein